MEQISIFDFFKTEPPDEDIQTLPETDMIRIITEQTGVEFQKDKNAPKSVYIWYSAKKGNSYIDVHYGHYFDGNKRFIGVGVGNNMGGVSCPCDSIKEAVGMIKRNISRYGFRR